MFKSTKHKLQILILLGLECIKIVLPPMLSSEQAALMIRIVDATLQEHSKADRSSYVELLLISSISSQ